MALESLGISKLDVYIALAINGLATGIGSAIGTYLATTHLIGGTKKIIDKIRRKNEKQK